MERSILAKSRKPKVRTRLVSVRVTEADHDLLSVRAQRTGTTFSEFARAKLLCDLAVPGGAPNPKEAAVELVTPLTPEAYATRQLTDQIRRIGVNLNQIAHRLNMLDQPATADLAPLLSEIRRYMQLVWARERR
jgi:hypothetical protein